MTDDAYQAALDYLYGFINYEHRRIERYSPEVVSLARPAALLALLGNPHHAFLAIHVAGTKGKGSVAALCAASLRAAGLRVGLYTSPHLQEFRDRIRILTPADADGRITEAQVVELVEAMKPIAPQVPELTWFELVTALAFLHFARQRVDVAVVEVGLGGRLDPTNVITPLVSVITSISRDHTYLLGDTPAEIAGEKGGIIKPDVPVVSAPQTPEALARLEEIAAERQALLTLAGREWTWEEIARTPEYQRIVVHRLEKPGDELDNQEFTIGLAGRHQQENAVVALAALALVRPRFPGLTLATIREGLATVQWPGRLQQLYQGNGAPTLLVDSAHNVDSARKLAWALAHDYTYQRLWLVLGATADKDVPGILRILLPLASGTIMTSSGHPRAVEPGQLLRLATELGYEAQASPTVAEAVAAAWQAAGPGDLICVTGSIFVVGDLLNQWEGLQSRLL
ncbi:MAG: bifunctional folylpolyglutamate synthase/dihydrofolate synthase [Chloroflexi bacterium]|nr:bifunctional folylpolyglutamate synthase/dihydrofolate synthase [Chloroflexota bacterium]MCI0578959.1 bifunctional folylpolyglutamate synthase/dihydrofolate synthase [Chloroflexota bacterium]MCI0645103.1 bifunctional folylpolyglutamate synthase/dihydrofolate synthase [Chloroflexota bacterium]MCI0731938.1 bifunctional folylpolyglutamate synthase/dihydrofolate synthase [Chloroflexota bacterium]